MFAAFYYFATNQSLRYISGLHTNGQYGSMNSICRLGTSYPGFTKHRFLKIYSHHEVMLGMICEGYLGEYDELFHEPNINLIRLIML